MKSNSTQRWIYTFLLILLISFMSTTLSTLWMMRLVQQSNIGATSHSSVPFAFAAPSTIAPFLPYSRISLPTSSLTLYIPSTTSVDHALTSAESDSVVRGMAKMLSHIAGGSTATPGTGYYVADNGALVIESVTLLQAYLTLTDEIRSEIELMAYDLCVRMKQESVLVVMDQMPVLLKPIKKVDQLWHMQV